MTLPIWEVLHADGRLLRYQGKLGQNDDGSIYFTDSHKDEDTTCIIARKAWLQVALVETNAEGFEFYPVNPPIIDSSLAQTPEGHCSGRPSVEPQNDPSATIPTRHQDLWEDAAVRRGLKRAGDQG